MGVFETIVIILEALCSIALIAVVLFQSGKEAGLSGALAGNTDSYLSKNKKGNLDHIPPDQSIPPPRHPAPLPHIPQR